MEIVKCRLCGNELKYNPSPSRIKRNKNFYCSTECSALSQRNRISMICKYCKIKFDAIPSKVRLGVKFCSKTCYLKWKGGSKLIKCEWCGANFSAISFNLKKHWDKFCSLNCYNAYRKRNNERRICKNCGIEFELTPSNMRKGGGTFCSHKCHSIHQKGEDSPTWKGGISFEPYCSKFNESLKEKIRIKFNRVCFMCGMNEKENGRKLSVHHIDYNKSCGCDTNDKRCYLIPLCMRCHLKTNYNRAYWEEKLMQKINSDIKEMGYYDEKEEKIEEKGD